MRRQRRREGDRAGEAEGPRQRQDRRRRRAYVVVAFRVHHEDVDAVPAQTSDLGREPARPDDVTADHDGAAPALPRQHLGNRRHRSRTFGIVRELGRRERTIAEPLASVPRHATRGRDRRQHEAGSAEHVERGVELGTEMPTERGIDLLEDERRGSRAGERVSHPRRRGARSERTALRVDDRDGAVLCDRTVAGRDHDSDALARRRELGRDVTRARQVVGDGGERRHRINTARAGAPSTPSSLSGRHESRYGPAAISRRSSPSMIKMPAPSRSLWTSKVLLPNCSIER